MARTKLIKGARGKLIKGKTDSSRFVSSDLCKVINRLEAFRRGGSGRWWYLETPHEMEEEKWAIQLVGLKANLLYVGKDLSSLVRRILKGYEKEGRKRKK